MPPEHGPSTSRRALIGVIVSSCGVAVAGCVEDGPGTPTGGEARSPVESPAASPSVAPTASSTARPAVRSDTFGFDVAVASQPTGDDPGRVTVTVTNESAVEWTYPVWPPDVAGENRVPFDDFTATGATGPELFLIPDHHHRISPMTPTSGKTPSLSGGDVPLVPSSPTDGCWKAGYESLLRVSIGEQRPQLQPDASFSETYSLLHSSSSDCTEGGTYEFATGKTVVVGGKEFEVGLSISLRIDGERSVSVESSDVRVSPPTPVEERDG